MLQESKRELPGVGKINVPPPEEKPNDDETLVYANKLVRILNVMDNLIF